jgi:hypothetical protein
MSDTPGTGGEATVARVFDAPRELVWKAYTEPERFAQWFGTPAGRTEVVYHQVGHLPSELYPLIEEGVAGFYERLAEHLARC